MLVLFAGLGSLGYLLLFSGSLQSLEWRFIYCLDLTASYRQIQLAHRNTLDHVGARSRHHGRHRRSDVVEPCAAKKNFAGREGHSQAAGSRHGCDARVTPPAYAPSHLPCSSRAACWIQSSPFREPGALIHSFRLIQNLIQLRLSPAENQIKPLRQPFPRPG